MFGREQPFVVGFATISIAALAVTSWVRATDDVAPEAKRFVLASAEVVELVGAPTSAQISESLFYEGVPGKEAPYRDYKMIVSGPHAHAIVIVRAQASGAEWSYRLRSLQKR